MVKQGVIPLLLVVFLAACGASAPAASAPAVSTGGSAPAASAAGSPVAAQAKPGASAAAAKLVVGFSQFIPQYLPLWVAQDAGIYARNGLEVDQHMLTSTTGVAALVAGELQFNVGGGPELLSAAAGGANVVGLANLTPVSAFKLEAAKDIQSKQDLVGKKVGVTRFGSNTDITMRALLQSEGIDPDKDVAFIQLDNNGNINAALLAGNIQAALAAPPQTLQLESKGFHTLYDLAQMKFPGTDAIVETDRTWLAAHPDVAQRYIDSLIEAMARMRQDKAITEATLKKNLKLDDQAALDAVYSYFVGSVFPTQPSLQAAQFNGVLPVLSKQSEKLKGYDLNKAFDNSLVKSAADRGVEQAKS